jgi:hypothetical protein
MEVAKIESVLFGLRAICCRDFLRTSLNLNRNNDITD